MTRKRFEKLMMSVGVSPVVVRMVTSGMIEARRAYETHKEDAGCCCSYEESFNRIIRTAILNGAVSCKQHEKVV